MNVDMCRTYVPHENRLHESYESYHSVYISDTC